MIISQVFRKVATNRYRGSLSWMLCILVLGLGILDASALNFYVENSTQFNAKVDKNGAGFATLRSGDRVYLKGGTWGGLVTTLNGSMTDAQAVANPAVIYACDANYTPTVGGVTVAGLSQISLMGSGIVFSGVTFGPSSGMLKRGNFTDYGGDDSSAFIFQMEGLSRHMTLSHVKFDDCGRDNTESTNDHYGAWISINGFRHTIQYCEIQGRDFNPNDINQTNPALRTSIRQATVIIYKATSDVTDWGYHTVRYNYFGERKTPLTADGDPTGRCYTPGDGSLKSDMTNGWETIRVGNSSYTSVDFNTTVEYNTFYHSIYAVDGGQYDNNGEPEAISNKSRKNTYRYNTILNNYGQLCLRQGDYCVVQGNYFLAGGAYDSSGNIVFTEPLNDRMGGVRAFGFGHTIANNYFYNIRGSGGLHSALMLGSGVTPTGTLTSLNNGDGASGYETANYTHVIGNTFIDCIYITLDSINGETYPVYGTQFFNNLIHYRSNISASGIFADTIEALTLNGGQAQGNYVYSSNSSQVAGAKTILGTTGNTITSTSSLSPLVTDKYDIALIPTASSPALGKAVALPAVTDTSLTGAAYSLAGNVATYGGLDIRGWSRPSTARDIGNYERESTGSEIRRPMRRSEVGRVASTYLIQQAATVALGSLAQTYSGTAKPATAVTTPTGLAVNFTYNGSPTAPTNAGNYTVVGMINDTNYAGNSTGTLVISKASAAVSLGSLAQTYTGGSKSATAVTTPVGLGVDFTYDGSATPPTNAGSYKVVGTINDVNYSGNSTDTLVVSRGTASVSLTGLEQTYTGTAKSAMAVTLPTGLTVDFTYNGSTDPPVNVGNYTVVGSVNQLNYTGNSTGTLVIAKGAGSVSLGNLTQSYTGEIRSATAVTVPLGLAVDFTYNGSSSAPTLPGTYTVVGSINDPSYAGSSTGNLVISKLSATVSLGGLLHAYDGASKSASAVTNPAGLAVTYSYTGSPLAAGSYPVVASVNDAIYAGSASGTLVITPAVATFNAAGVKTWTCPANVNSIQVECWGGGGAGGSARRGSSNTATGGGGAGGAYARVESWPVIPGNTYFLAVGDGGISSSIADATVSGGDTWFNSANSTSSVILAKGGAGGATAVTSTASLYGAGGVGSASGSLGDVVNAGGSGATSTSGSSGGGGGGSGGNSLAGISALPGTSLGAAAVNGGGNGGNPNPTSGTSADGQTPTSPPGGGGGGARSANTVGHVGGRGAAGQIILTLQADTVPNPPTDVAAHAGSSQALVSFIPPTNTGGLAVIDYTVTASPGGVTATGMGSPLVITGLSNGTSYTFTVTARNLIGSSVPSSASPAVTLSLESEVVRWRQTYFSSSENTGTAADGADPDDDGVTNANEYIFGSNPTTSDGGALLRIAANAGISTLTFTAQAALGTGYTGVNRSYTIETTSNLIDPSSWIAIDGYSDIPGSGQIVSVIPATNAGRSFYRLKVTIR